MHGTITILVDNLVRKPGLKAEHGLSCLVQVDSYLFLWDTGQTDLLLHNAKALKINLSKIEAIVLSHGHYDHTGGLLPVLEMLDKPVPVYAHPDIFSGHYAVMYGKSRSIGPDFTEKQLKNMGVELILSRKPIEIFPGVKTTGEIPRLTDFEDVGGKWFKDVGLTIPDQLKDDQSLVIETRKGLIVVLGCTHSGVINTLQHVRKLYPGKNIDAVIGGMHLAKASERRMSKTIEMMKEIGVRIAIPGHCTGIPQSIRLSSEFSGPIPILEVGFKYKFSDS